MAQARRKRKAPDGWHTVADAAEMLGVSVSTVRRWIRAGRLHAHRISPKAIRLRNDEVREAATPAANDDKPYNMMAHIYTDIEEARRPMTEGEKRRARAAVAAMREFSRSSPRRRGVSGPDSAELIREGREERSRQLEQR